MALSVTGLEKDFYLVNNPIIIEAVETSDVKSFMVTIGSYAPMEITPINNRIKINVSSHLKTLFPELTNLITSQIRITSINTLGQTISDYNVTKRFIRGGKRGVQTNVTVQPNKALKVTDKIPYWVGYPQVYSYLNNSANPPIIEDVLLNPDFMRGVERRKIKGCNSVYVRFLNSLGGYSYWMFEGVTDQQKNTNSGIINNTVQTDLGNSFEQEIELFSKVPKAYLPLIQDLIISSHIQVYKITDEGVVWERYYSASNTIESNPAKNAQSVKIKLKPFQKYNPEVIWQ